VIHGYLSQGDAGIRVDLHDGYPKGGADSRMMFVFAFWKNIRFIALKKSPKGLKFGLDDLFLWSRFQQTIF